MNQTYIDAMNSFTLGEETKRKIISNLIEYRDKALKAKIQKSNVLRSKWAKLAFIGMTTSAVLFCAIFSPIVSSGSSNRIAAFKTQLLGAFNTLMTTDSYEETLEISVAIDGITTTVKYTTKYQKTDGGYIAEGVTETAAGTGITTQRYFFADGYLYMPVMPVEGRENYGGVKFKSQENLISFSQFFTQNSGYLTLDTIRQLDKKSKIKSETINGNSVYSFKEQATAGINSTSFDYKITVNADRRILEINQTGFIIMEGKTANTVSVAVYDYVAVKVNLPDNLDTYIEYMG